MTAATTEHQVRWLIRRDLDEVNSIERDHPDGLFDAEIMRHLKQRNCIGVVAEACDGPIDGYMIYALEPESIHLIRIAVSSHAIRTGVGRKMVHRLQDKLTFQGEKRCAITVDVDERNLRAQLFFAACGFRAIGCDDEVIWFRFENY